MCCRLFYHWSKIGRKESSINTCRTVWECRVECRGSEWSCWQSQTLHSGESLQHPPSQALQEFQTVNTQQFSQLHYISTVTTTLTAAISCIIQHFFFTKSNVSGNILVTVTVTEALVLHPLLKSKVKKSKVKKGIAVCKQACHHRYGNSHAIWDHTVLHATRQRWHSRLYLS